MVLCELGGIPCIPSGEPSNGICVLVEVVVSLGLEVLECLGMRVIFANWELFLVMFLEEILEVVPIDDLLGIPQGDVLT